MPAKHERRRGAERRAVQEGFEVGLLGDEAEERWQRAMLAVAPTAMINSGRLRCPSQASLRISRVPVAWSMMPTTMNSAP